MRRKVLDLSRHSPESPVGRALRLPLRATHGPAIRERAEPLLRDAGYGHGATCAFARCQRVLRWEPLGHDMRKSSPRAWASRRLAKISALRSSSRSRAT